MKYKIGLVKTLIDRVYKINNTWIGFHKDIIELKNFLSKNAYPPEITDKCIFNYLNKQTSPVKDNQSENNQTKDHYFKLPYIGQFSKITQRKISKLVNQYCNGINIKLVFTNYKISNFFNVKDLIPKELHSRVVYKFVCASCSACYVGETSRHLTTRVNEHLRDKASHIFQHLQASTQCRDVCNEDCFEIIDTAISKYQLKLKEAMHIKWVRPSLNQQVYHANITLKV